MPRVNPNEDPVFQVNKLYQEVYGNQDQFLLSQLRKRKITDCVDDPAVGASTTTSPAPSLVPLLPQYGNQDKIIKVGLEGNGLGTAKKRHFDGMMTKAKNYGCTNNITTSAPAEKTKTTTISLYPTW